MAFFDNLTTLLKQKWLEFFQANRAWLVHHMEVEAVYTPDGGRRPSSYLILGVVNALEPSLAELMLPFSKLNPNADALIDALELNFDPDLVFGNRFNPQAVPDELSDESSEMFDEEVTPITVIQALTELDPEAFGGMSVNDMPEQVVLVESDEEPLVVLSPAEADLLGDMLLEEMANETALQESDDESIEQPTGAEKPDEIGDVLSDVWGEQTSSESEQADEKRNLGDETQI